MATSGQTEQETRRLIREGGPGKDPMIKRRNRAKHVGTFEERLAERALKSTQAASRMPKDSKARQRLLRHARQLETASDISKWLSSPQLQPSKIPELLFADLKKRPLT